MAMTRAQFRKQLQNGLNAVFGLEYKRYPELWRDIFEVKSSEKAYEEQVCGGPRELCGTDPRP
jgi:hypothetical protein